MQVVIIGAGGHGKVVLDILRARGELDVAGFLDADVALTGIKVGGIEVLGAPNLLPKLLRQKVRQAIVAIGDNRTRVQYAHLVREQGLELVNAIHPSAAISSTADLGLNIVVAAHAVIGTESTVADSAIVNTGALVDHECRIGAGAHICPGACLAGRVCVEPGAFVGLGARVIQCLTIGQGAIVGAGAVVTRDVGANTTVIGVPARVVRSGSGDILQAP